jgi:hypothetical protein
VREKAKLTTTLIGTDLVADGVLSLPLRGADMVTDPRLRVGQFVEDDAAP